MAASLPLKIYNAKGEYIAAARHYEDAAGIASMHSGSTVRYGHAKRTTLWAEGKEKFLAGESYDLAADVMRSRYEQYAFVKLS